MVITHDGVALRSFPGKNTTLLREMPRGTKLALLEAPVDVDGLRWWHVKNEKYDGWAAESSGSQRLLSPVE
ncbi:MAG: SH3 domain-containing protein [Anaerolineae bacterium]|nr:SH3 domain-containing protein [Anaerolineae bacterium]